MKKITKLSYLSLLLTPLGVQAQQTTNVGINETLVNSQDKFALINCQVLSSVFSVFGVVFLILIVVYAFFKLFKVILAKKPASDAARLADNDMITSKEAASGDVYAAISMALYELNNEAHDIENMVLTIKRARISYSPWSSKIYGLTQLPVKK